jgi:excisionase family DNA binding protein
MSEQKFYTITEAVAKLKEAGLHFSDRTLRNWIKSGKIKAVRPGDRQWYIPVAEVERIVNIDQTHS